MSPIIKSVLLKIFAISTIYPSEQLCTWSQLNWIGGSRSWQDFGFRSRTTQSADPEDETKQETNRSHPKKPNPKTWELPKGFGFFKAVKINWFITTLLWITLKPRTLILSQEISQLTSLGCSFKMQWCWLNLKEFRLWILLIQSEVLEVCLENVWVFFVSSLLFIDDEGF